MTATRFFWPSDYSGMIVHHLQSDPDLTRGRRVCDIGTGSGILAAAALHLGAAEVVATDVDPDALALAGVSLTRVAPAARFDLLQGNLWEPLPAGSQFDLVLANLPNFPAEEIATDGRRATWSVGGADGRGAIDPFLAGLPQRLGAGGLAVFTQNRCIGLAATLEQLHAKGLVAEVRASALVPIGPEKIAALSTACIEPSGIIEVAGFVFLGVDLIVAQQVGQRVGQPDRPRPEPGSQPGVFA
jgi:release factor glutamine methyltransferase